MRCQRSKQSFALECLGEELYDAVKDVDALITRSGTAVDAKLLDAAEELKVVARVGVGVDNIDLAAASKRGVHRA